MKTFFCKLMAGCLLLLSCKKEENAVLDFSDPFGDSAENPYEVPTLEDSQRPMLICEQSLGRAIIVDSLSKGILWEWKAADHLPGDRAAWFKEIDEAKAVYNRQYVLVTASSGGVALVRVQDKKTMFYTNAKGGPHSAEVLPDGNIVVACSTNGTADGDALKIYRVDSANAYVAAETKRYTLTFGHNVVWDQQRNLLWATDNNYLYSFTYNNNGSAPELTAGTEFYKLPDVSPHDLFPVYGKEALFLTTAGNIYEFNIESKTFTKTAYSKKNIKSISSGPAGFGTLLIEPNQSYWTNRVTNDRGSSVFFGEGFKMYKARWFITNPFSYPAAHAYKQTK